MNIDDRDRQELIARWQRCHAGEAAVEPLDGAITELIDEACRGVNLGRISAERCARAGDAIGWAWRAGGRELAQLADEFALLRRSVWDTVVGHLRSDGASLDSIVDARAMIDLTFDIALRRALGASATTSLPEPAVEVRPAVDRAESSAQADFHLYINTALADCSHRGTSLALIVLHIELRQSEFELFGPGADLADLGDVLSAELRRTDRCFAFTESDFGIVCLDTDHMGARRLLDRICSSARLFGRRAGTQVDLTGGCAAIPDDGASTLDLIRVALADREFSIPGGPDAGRV